MASVPRSDASDSRVLDAKESNVPDGFKPHHEAVGMGRENFTPLDIVKEIWAGLGLPETSLDSVILPGSNSGPALPSSYRIGCLAQSSIAVSALAAALIHSTRNGSPVPTVTVPQRHAVVEFKSVQFCSIQGEPERTPRPPVLGLHKTADGYIRIHDAFPNHRDGTLQLLGLSPTASRSDVADKTRQWNSIDLETAGLQNKLAMYALRSYKEWDALPQAAAIDKFPISIQRICNGPASLPPRMAPGNDRCLRGLRVLELTRVIAGPLAGRTLAAHGADVLWVTCPSLPDLPAVDRDLARGKRSIQLDLRDAAGKAKLLGLIASCDVFIQGYRPGSLAARGLAPEQLAEINPGIVCANMSAFGPEGPWKERRGFDSLVQTASGMNVSEAEHYGGGEAASGMNVSEAEHYGGGEAARILPCQALDHGSGYLLATGICAALWRRATEGGAWRVDVSLAGTMKYLRSLGQYKRKSGFKCADVGSPEEVEEFLETRQSGFGPLRAVRHSASVDGREPGWDLMPKPLGSDEPEWLR